MTRNVLSARTLLAVCFYLGVAAAATACSTELGPPPPGQSVFGEVTYDGDALSDFDEPVLMVVALLTTNPDATPYAVAFIPNPDLSQPVPYELQYLPAYDFLVVARVVESSDADSGNFLIGAFPDACVLTSVPSPRPVVVGEDEATTGIDITLYDDVFDDPCFAETPDFSADRCPSAEEGTVAVTLEYDGETPSAGDLVVAAVLDVWPPTGGALAGPIEPLVIPATALDFPQEIGLNGVPGGDYAVYACLVRAGDQTDAVCGQDDAWAVLGDDALTPIEAGRITNVTLDLSEGTGIVTSVDDPGEECGATGTDVVVRVSSDTLTPESGDELSVALFAGVPAPPPDYSASVEPASFPVDVVVEDVEAGEYFMVVCFDKGGGQEPNCGGEGDVLHLYENLTQKLTVEGEELVVEVSL